MFSYGIETVLFGRVFAVVGRSAPREFFECARKVALRRKAQICADCGERFVGVDKQALRLFDSLFRDRKRAAFCRRITAVYDFDKSKDIPVNKFTGELKKPPTLIEIADDGDMPF